MCVRIMLFSWILEHGKSVSTLIISAALGVLAVNNREEAASQIAQQGATTPCVLLGRQYGNPDRSLHSEQTEK